MSNLYCPNCDHLIGSLKPAQSAQTRGAGYVNTWQLAVGWEGWETSGELYSRYCDWAAGRSLVAPTQIAFSKALLDAGAVWKRSNKGRVYSRS